MSERMDRRATLRLIGGAALAVTAGLTVTDRALAGITWCRSDPWVVIKGTHLNVFPERDANAPNLCSGPILLEFQVPPGVNGNVLAADNGFGFGYDISFVESTSVKDNQYGVRMYVPASSGSMAVRLVCDPVDPTAKTTLKAGTANSWISVITKI